MPRIKQPADIPHGHKFCTACRTIHPIANFSPDRARKDGLRQCCKPCASRRVQASKARRRALSIVGRTATNPASVTPAQRAAHDAAFVAALTEVHRPLAVAREGKSRPRPPRAPRPAATSAGHPYPTAAAQKIWFDYCGNR